MANPEQKRPLLTASQISKRYGKHLALSPLSFTAKKGEIIALCGGNGAGKSTMIRILAGMFPPSSGTVELKGIHLIHDRKKYAREIGYMPDDFNFPSLLSVREWLSFFASLRGISEDQVTKSLEMVGLLDRSDVKCTSLSKGMRQRLLFAQACVANPDILLLDEPTNGLDPFWMAALGKMLRRMKDEQKTVLFSTHQINFAVELADVILFIHEGRLLQQWNRNEYDEESIMGEMKQLIEQHD